MSTGQYFLLRHIFDDTNWFELKTCPSNIILANKNRININLNAQFVHFCQRIKRSKHSISNVYTEKFKLINNRFKIDKNNLTWTE